MLPNDQNSEFYGDDNANEVTNKVDINDDDFDMGNIIEIDDENDDEKVANFDEEYDFRSDDDDDQNDDIYFVQ